MTAGETKNAPLVQRNRNQGEARSVELGLWANEQCVVSAIILFFGGILGVAGMFKNWQFAAAVIPAALLILLIEWPRGNRLNGKRTVQRSCQTRLTVMVKSIGPLKNYYIRTLIMLTVSVPSCFLLPTILGGLGLGISSILYFVAAVNKEEWKPIETSNRSKTDPDIFSAPPSIPPPRNPASSPEFVVEVTDESEKIRF